MKETPKYVKEVQDILTHLESDDDNQDGQPPDTVENEFDAYIEEDRITLIPRRLHGIPVQRQDVVDSIISDLDTTPLTAQPAGQATSGAALGVWFFGLFLILSCLMFQFYVLFNPLTATITLLTKSQQLTMQGTLQLGRFLNPITLSQSQTTQTTGHGHQDARAATGELTFYNGQLQSVFVPAGTILTGTDGVQIITDADANIPAANPPTWGIMTVSAHTVSAGASGNIAPYDINQGCCTGVKAVNPTSFSGGQNERDFRTVAKSDITNTAAPLKATLNQGVSGVLQEQLQTNEGLVTPSCATTTTSDHQPGDEATQVKVTVSETCSAVAVNQDEMQAEVTRLLTVQATEKFGDGYSLLGTPQVNIIQATAQHTKVVLSFKAQSTWIDALSNIVQERMKKLIEGKTTQQALQMLRSLPGIEKASVEFSGFGDAIRLPKNTSNIHLMLIYGL